MVVLFQRNYLQMRITLPTLQKNNVFMAKVLFSALISEMRNKLNGSVFSRNRGGNYLRNKVTPLNPQTTFQQAARALLITFSQTWRTLSSAEQEAWNNAVDQWATTDIFGNLRNPSGHQLFIRLNINIDLAGGTQISLPPAPQGVNAIDSLSLTADSAPQTYDVAYTPTPTPASHAMYLESTIGMSPGISNANSDFRFIALIPPASASPFAGIAAQTTKFGAVIAGQKYFVRAKFIRTDTGEVSGPLVALAIAS